MFSAWTEDTSYMVRIVEAENVEEAASEALKYMQPKDFEKSAEVLVAEWSEPKRFRVLDLLNKKVEAA